MFSIFCGFPAELLQYPRIKRNPPQPWEARRQAGFLFFCLPREVGGVPGAAGGGGPLRTPASSAGQPGLTPLTRPRSGSALGKTGEDPGHVAGGVLEVDDPEVLVGAVSQVAGP